MSIIFRVINATTLYGGFCGIDEPILSPSTISQIILKLENACSESDLVKLKGVLSKLPNVRGLDVYYHHDDNLKRVLEEFIDKNPKISNVKLDGLSLSKLPAGTTSLTVSIIDDNMAKAMNTSKYLQSLFITDHKWEYVDNIKNCLAGVSLQTVIFYTPKREITQEMFMEYISIWIQAGKHMDNFKYKGGDFGSDFVGYFKKLSAFHDLMKKGGKFETLDEEGIWNSLLLNIKI